MRKIIYLLFVSLFIIHVVGCSDSIDRTGQAKTPSGSRIQEGRMYQEVIDDFEEQGFTNIQTEAVEDLILGWLTKDGEVESVTVEGDVDYSSDTWYPNDVPVVITYHTFPSTDSEAIENNEPSEETVTDYEEVADDESQSETIDNESNDESQSETTNSESSDETEEDYSEINQLISESLELSQGWALGILDENGYPTENGTPSPTHAFSLYILDIKYEGDNLIIRVLPEFEQLNNDDRTYIINFAQNMANVHTNNIPYTSIRNLFGDIIGSSKVTNSESFKWN